MSKDKAITLFGENAINLYLQGSDIWNKWVKDNPDANVYFTGVDFSKFHQDGMYSANFKGFCFPSGVIDFSDAIFGNGLVSFTEASFNGFAVLFKNTDFGNGDVNFYFTKFLEASVSFQNAKFGAGNISFNEAMFGGAIDFSNITIEDGNLNFYGAYFDATILNFTFMTINGGFNFLYAKNTENIREISFKYSNFNGYCEITNSSFSCVVDLTQTKMANHVSLEGLVCEPIEVSHYKFLKKTFDKDNISRFRRLKELAENNKDHERALDFHAKEMRSKRFHENTTYTGLFFDYSFDLLSNYGRSELRPFIALVVIWFLFALFYLLISPIATVCFDGYCLKLGEALSFSGGQVIPIIPGSQLARAESIKKLFSGNLTPLIHLLTFLQSLISFTLFFLIGLALRNRFRI
ncbi:hypothetical protein EU508_14965 [Pseudoalteromonas fuliginea]|uniref:Pentapeptide repeat-containing protein n=1 Tax=Pseudoalteromonas fuliginea TaxID=1872678 RepID=A0AB73BF41_9GAMM|nr:hypothetical protein [Pseudoalteromonas fuliginea]KAA1158791.1 hypothetical protein EU508_14965 [Pseudoalteromonas fuliginea]